MIEIPGNLDEFLEYWNFKKSNSLHNDQNGTLYLKGMQLDIGSKLHLAGYEFTFTGQSGITSQVGGVLLYFYAVDNQLYEVELVSLNQAAAQDEHFNVIPPEEEQ